MAHWSFDDNSNAHANKRHIPERVTRQCWWELNSFMFDCNTVYRRINFVKRMESKNFIRKVLQNSIKPGNILTATEAKLHNPAKRRLRQATPKPCLMWIIHLIPVLLFLRKCSCAPGTDMYLRLPEDAGGFPPDAEARIIQHVLHRIPKYSMAERDHRHVDSTASSKRRVTYVSMEARQGKTTWGSHSRGQRHQLEHQVLTRKGSLRWLTNTSWTPLQLWHERKLGHNQQREGTENTKANFESSHLRQVAKGAS